VVSPGVRFFVAPALVSSDWTNDVATASSLFLRARSSDWEIAPNSTVKAMARIASETSSSMSVKPRSRRSLIGFHPSSEPIYGQAMVVVAVADRHGAAIGAAVRIENDDVRLRFQCKADALRQREGARARLEPVGLVRRVEADIRRGTGGDCAAARGAQIVRQCARRGQRTCAGHRRLDERRSGCEDEADNRQHDQQFGQREAGGGTPTSFDGWVGAITGLAIGAVAVEIELAMLA